MQHIVYIAKNTICSNKDSIKGQFHGGGYEERNFFRSCV